MSAWRRNPRRHYSIIQVPLAPPPPTIIENWERLPQTFGTPNEDTIYLRDRYNSSFMTPKQLAQTLGLRPNYVTGVLKSHGCNVSSTESRSRLNHQVEHLIRSGASVAEMAQQLSFTRGTIHSYLRRFKREQAS